MRFRSACTTVLLGLPCCAVLAACGEQAPGTAAAREATRAVAPERRAYREVALSNVGRLTGVIEADPARLLAVRAEAEEDPGCGARPRRARRSEDAELVVWVDGVREGKGLPVERRYAITIDGCRYAPAVQGALVGGALHVKSMDDVQHVTRLVRAEGGALLAEVRQAEEGALMPLDRVLARAGVIEARCALHDRAEAWIAVFDHPYWVTTRVSAAFAIDSLPPGAHTVVAWHPKLGMVRREVDVEAGASASVRLKF